MPTESPDSASAGHTAEQDTLHQSIQAVIETYPEATVGIAIRDAATGTRYDYNAERVFHAASTMKVPVMIEAFRRAERADVSMEDELLENEPSALVIDCQSVPITRSGGLCGFDGNKKVKGR